MIGPRIEYHERPGGRRSQRICAALLGLCVLGLSPSFALGETPQAAAEREYQVKAAFVYNFLKFVVGGRFGTLDDKGGSNGDPNEVLRVGIVGRAPSKEGLASLQGKVVKDKRIEVRFFEGLEDRKEADAKTTEPHPQMKELRQCHVLFFCPSEKPFLARLLPALQKDGLLLVGDTPGFLEAGGVINLMIEDKKVRFEINLAAAAREHLQIRSSLLRLALRTIEHDSLEKPDDEGKSHGSKKP
jgi:hypothetical protein